MSATPKPGPSTRPPVGPVSNAEKARALISMLEGPAATPADVPPERLRDWASDLIRTVEGERPKPAKSDKPAPVMRRRIFTKAAPKLNPMSEDSERDTAVASRLNLTAPVPHRAEPAAAAEGPVLPGHLAAEDVRKVVEATVHPATLSREHPAIIAMTLLGKPSLEQASALRSLPGGQVRAVHRALRQLQQRPAPPVEART